MDNFRVVRNFGEYAGNEGYATSLADQRAVARAAAAPWYTGHMNMYEDFGAFAPQPLSSAIGGGGGGSGGGSGGAGSGGGRKGGGGGSGQGGRYGMQRYPMKQRNIRRQHIQYPYSPVPDNVPHKEISVTSNSCFCFHGYANIFTLQHRFDFIIDGETYKSIDQYYQQQKVKDLTGISSGKFTDGSTRDYSSLARELLRQASIKRSDVESWRTGRGLDVIQKAILEKLRQCQDMRNALTSTGDKILVQSFGGDDYYGSGTPAKYVKDWCSGIEKNKGSLKGKNVLGALFMILREKLNNSQLDDLNFSFSKSASVGGGQTGMDFTVDSNS
uniref:NADAR domain-containing protein n=1 Tax=Meloidogyne floridensis TaxID=298350 RepID=A0A915P658_9BILA